MNPPNYHTTSTEQPLGTGPNDMPDRGKTSPEMQSSSSMVPLSKTPHPVAQFGANPGMGTVQSTSTGCDLSRKATSPYGRVSGTTPQTDGKK